ncbi:MAG: hypothetical protein EOP48_15625 [Sphingobacteriales bacterium]|nr:MAG: hypothetical protein EOP48_15625 [Sphingobacteriales bacterium]
MQQFIGDLNQLYCLKSHLTERLVDLEGQPAFKNASTAIKNLVIQTDAELENLDQVFIMLERRVSFENCTELSQYLEGIYTDITEALETPQLSHVFFYEYLCEVKTIEKTSLASMCRISMTIANPELKSLLLKECEKPECELLKTFRHYYPASFVDSVGCKSS